MERSYFDERHCLRYGAWLIYVPAGFIVGGVLLILAAVLAARGQRPGN